MATFPGDEQRPLAMKGRFPRRYRLFGERKTGLEPATFCLEAREPQTHLFRPYRICLRFANTSAFAEHYTSSRSAITETLRHRKPEKIVPIPSYLELSHHDSPLRIPVSQRTKNDQA